MPPKKVRIASDGPIPPEVLQQLIDTFGQMEGVELQEGVLRFDEPVQVQVQVPPKLSEALSKSQKKRLRKKLGKQFHHCGIKELKMEDDFVKAFKPCQ